MMGPFVFLAKSNLTTDDTDLLFADLQEEPWTAAALGCALGFCGTGTPACACLWGVHIRGLT